jgi:hypothetical protein
VAMTGGGGDDAAMESIGAGGRPAMRTIGSVAGQELPRRARGRRRIDGRGRFVGNGGESTAAT